MKMELVDYDDRKEIEKNQNDEVSFVIKKLCKEATKLKGLNVLHFKNLKENILEIKYEEKDRKQVQLHEHK